VVAKIKIVNLWGVFVLLSILSVLFTKAALADGEKVVPRIIKDCNSCAEMIELPTGQFIMGATKEEYSSENGNLIQYMDETPLHDVRINHFLLAKFSVTRAQFSVFAAETGFSGKGCEIFNGRYSKFDRSADWENPGFHQGDQDPVVCISWLDAKKYLNWLNEKLAGRSTVFYRLPTEAEWEYAARAGTASSTYWGNERASQCKFENGRDLAAKSIGSDVPHVDCNDGYVNTSPVGHFLPNPWGLFDMLGNASQWTEDCSHIGYKVKSPIGSENCSMRVVRGGGWAAVPFAVRSASRLAFKGDARKNTVGFRLAADVKTK